MSLREAIPEVLLEQARAGDETLPAAAKSTSTWIARGLLIAVLVNAPLGRYLRRRLETA